MKKKHGKSKKNLFPILCAVLLFILLLLLALRTERRLIPPLKEISHIQCKAFANQIIDAAVEDTLADMALSQADLLQEVGEEGYTANTVLVNRFCSSLSSRITQDLIALPREVIQIPLGAASGISFLANSGPNVPFTLLPMGAVEADYETAFQSVGINQINYKIWVRLTIQMKIVNPLYQETLQMERKMMLADLILSGKVPSHYFQMNPNSLKSSSANEYLLTE